LRSKKRDVTGNRKYPCEFYEQCVAIIKKDYFDYEPTLAAEKLLEYNDHC